MREPTEEVDTARILDASANRAREALRVLEDYARFTLNDAVLCGQLKQMRHDLANALGLLPASLLLEARDTPHDVGTAISTAEEWDRPSMFAVVQANAKRLQEALRSLEEFGKIAKVEFSAQRIGEAGASTPATRWSVRSCKAAACANAWPTRNSACSSRTRCVERRSSAPSRKRSWAGPR